MTTINTGPLTEEEMDTLRSLAGHGMQVELASASPKVDLVDLLNHLYDRSTALQHIDVCEAYVDKSTLEEIAEEN